MMLLAELFSWNGRIGKSRYIFVTFSILIFSILILSSIDTEIIVELLLIILLVIWLIQGIKRCHDFGYSGWFQLAIPVSTLLMMMKPGDPHENQYGPPPGARRPMGETQKGGQESTQSQAPVPVNKTLPDEAPVAAKDIPNQCPTCRNPNPRKLQVCEWCGSKIY